MKQKLVSTAVLILLLLCGTASADPILSLTTPDITGSPGTTIGWDFTIVNATDYVMITSADFCLPPSCPVHSSLGTFTDYIAQFNFTVVGPSPENPTLSQVFDEMALTGIGAFAIDPGATVGSTDSGQIVLSYDLFSVSPNDPAFDPFTHTISTGNLLVADASVAVSSGAIPIPEPATVLLLSVGLAAALGRIHAQRR